jgi:hypothetical protein
MGSRDGSGQGQEARASVDRPECHGCVPTVREMPWLSAWHAAAARASSSVLRLASHKSHAHGVILSLLLFKALRSGLAGGQAEQ